MVLPVRAPWYQKPWYQFIVCFLSGVFCFTGYNSKLDGNSKMPVTVLDKNYYGSSVSISRLWVEFSSQSIRLKKTESGGRKLFK